MAANNSVRALRARLSELHEPDTDGDWATLLAVPATSPQELIPLLRDVAAMDPAVRASIISDYGMEWTTFLVDSLFPFDSVAKNSSPAAEQLALTWLQTAVANDGASARDILLIMNQALGRLATAVQREVNNDDSSSEEEEGEAVNAESSTDAALQSTVRARCAAWVTVASLRLLGSLAPTRVKKLAADVVKMWPKGAWRCLSATPDVVQLIILDPSTALPLIDLAKPDRADELRHAVAVVFGSCIGLFAPDAVGTELQQRVAQVFADYRRRVDLVAVHDAVLCAMVMAQLDATEWTDEDIVGVTNVVELLFRSSSTAHWQYATRLLEHAVTHLPSLAARALPTDSPTTEAVHHLVSTTYVPFLAAVCHDPAIRRTAFMHWIALLAALPAVTEARLLLDILGKCSFRNLVTATVSNILRPRIAAALVGPVRDPEPDLHAGMDEVAVYAHPLLHGALVELMAECAARVAGGGEGGRAGTASGEFRGHVHDPDGDQSVLVAYLNVVYLVLVRDRETNWTNMWNAATQRSLREKIMAPLRAQHARRDAGAVVVVAPFLLMAMDHVDELLTKGRLLDGVRS
ncbi:hypothetical protein GGF31_003267 [Allomyces arbusculus]|nr:hypothetical protein GGF31_003267 [Allomyces arbusculus]